ncbi:hypothetical protein [Burkholderia vietnamiensis]|uniref:hypothetical protein n=1 Tax=Burkholderia vietnamiensis TaxID=60552 RepID=UPI0012D9FF01|nr:hypothetical protein [Burkholderia vietnamiensis]
MQRSKNIQMKDSKSITEQIEAVLSQFWDDNAIPVDNSADDTLEYMAPLDSMSAVEVLTHLDEIVGKALDAGSVIRKGGYDTKEQFISDVTTKVLAHIGTEVT